MTTEDRIKIIKTILEKSNNYKTCTHCGFTYLDLGCGDECPQCGKDIYLEDEYIELLSA